MSPLKTLDLHRIFEQLDKNGDGLVSIEELIWLLESIGVHANQDELELLVGKKSLDPIDFVFFHDLIIKNNVGEGKLKEKEEDNLLEKDLFEAFQVFDLNGDGFISSEELQSALCRLGLWDERKDCKTMINVYDINSDGKLDFEEFKNMMLVSNF